ncbi:MAG: hypothetical protein JXQ27_16220 [Acidobacteria bacterium]|nr:hypothetical protein [Acidobacteriota bacterium]
MFRYWKTILLLIPGCLWLLAGCAPNTRHKVLRTVFDGVPPPRPAAATSPAATPAPTDQAGTADPASLRPTGSVHQPYADRECNSCHGTRLSNQLILPPDQLCQECHDPAEFSAPWLHGPVAGGGCSSCHLPHRSEKAHLLRNGGDNFCLDCHDPRQGLMDPDSPAHRQPNGYDCLDCHTAHGGATRFLLKSGRAS